MTCEELRDQYELYAIGVAEEPERSEIRQHLNRGCEVCMTGMKRAREVTTIVGGTAVPSAPSPKLRRRILAAAGFEQQRYGWGLVWALPLALSLFAAVYFSGRERDVVVELNRTRSQMRQQEIDLARMNEAFAIVNGADTTVTSFGQGQPAPPKGKIFVSLSQGVLLIASNLPPAPAGKAYEMWVIPKGGKPVPAGIFQSETNGSAIHIQRGPVDANADLVAVTVEDQAGAAQPTSQPLFAASVRGLLP
jgi:anti-sigma-K factor RskA